jgi:hypothetical protein
MCDSVFDLSTKTHAVIIKAEKFRFDSPPDDLFRVIQDALNELRTVTSEEFWRFSACKNGCAVFDHLEFHLEQGDLGQLRLSTPSFNPSG